jgi:hypothetical protein
MSLSRCLLFTRAFLILEYLKIFAVRTFITSEEIPRAAQQSDQTQDTQED